MRRGSAINGNCGSEDAKAVQRAAMGHNF